ncbi:hypothetical protein CKAH01_18938 [Colletotrichum kahawae]|uniref:Uncharacterized protein n=1 Tax=Colletotrichum kahawae TaxID=34407 RepID=A0AAD9Y2W7_COLKA|nr:hypothetical protein CKAH01_18938 [Colletotrichum kahawae]
MCQIVGGLLSLLIIDSNDGGLLERGNGVTWLHFPGIWGALSGIPYDSRLEGTSSTLDGL